MELFHFGGHELIFLCECLSYSVLNGSQIIMLLVSGYQVKLKMQPQRDLLLPAGTSRQLLFFCCDLPRFKLVQFLSLHAFALLRQIQ